MKYISQLKKKKSKELYKLPCDVIHEKFYRAPPLMHDNAIHENFQRNTMYIGTHILIDPQKNSLIMVY